MEGEVRNGVMNSMTSLKSIDKIMFKKDHGRPVFFWCDPFLVRIRWKRDCEIKRRCWRPLTILSQDLDSLWMSKDSPRLVNGISFTITGYFKDLP